MNLARHIFLLSLLLQAPVLLPARQLEVGGPRGYQNLAEGIAKAEAGDTLLLNSGIYKECDLLINKPLCIIGREGAIVDAEMRSEIMVVEADSVTIIGLILRNVGSSFTKDFAALRIRKSRHFRIEGNRFENVFFGIYLQNAHEGLISRNVVTGNGRTEFYSGNGIHLWQCSEVNIEKNETSLCRDGIYLEFVSNSSVNGNHSFRNARYGLHFMFSNDDEYHRNRFERNGAGVAVMFSKRIRMHYNRFEHNWGTASYALLLKEIYDADIRYNHFEANSVGINAEGSNRVEYRHNVFIRNGWAIKVLGGCYSNHFYTNDFIANSFDVAYSGQLNDNRFEGNFWSSYWGYDLNQDGIGDIPYRPVRLFNYIVNKTPESILLLRSFFIYLINIAEQVSPIFTPLGLLDEKPRMKAVASS